MAGRFVIIEGIDGVGKTTLAKLVAKKVGGFYYHTPPKFFTNECRQIDKNGVSFDERRLGFFVGTVAYASDEIRKMIVNGHDVIADRWIWTTFAYHFAANPILHKKHKNNWRAMTTRLQSPDLSILMHINNEQIWSQRMAEREVSKSDSVILCNPGLRKKVFRLFLQLNPNFQLVENSGHINKSVSTIMKLMDC